MVSWHSQNDRDTPRTLPLYSGRGSFVRWRQREWSYKNTLRVSLRTQELQVLCHLFQFWPRESLWGLFTSSSLNRHHHHLVFIIPILGTIKWKQIAVATKQIMRGSDRDSSPRAGWTATRCQAILNACLCSCPPLTKSYKWATLHPVIIIIILTIPYPSYFPCHICTCVWLCLFVYLFIFVYLFFLFLCFGARSCYVAQTSFKPMILLLPYPTYISF